LLCSFSSDLRSDTLSLSEPAEKFGDGRDAERVPGCPSGRALRCTEVRAQRGPQGYACRQPRSATAHQAQRGLFFDARRLSEMVRAPVRFGRKSEKLTGELEQLEFPLEELETAQAAEEAAQALTEAAQPASARTDSKGRSRPARKTLPQSSAMYSGSSDRPLRKPTDSIPLGQRATECNAL
jgi:hypothetical protein